MRFEFVKKTGDDEQAPRLALGKINFYGPHTPAAKRRNQLEAADIVH